jgi:hypothetical protein
MIGAVKGTGITSARHHFKESDRTTGKVEDVPTIRGDATVLRSEEREQHSLGRMGGLDGIAGAAFVDPFQKATPVVAHRRRIAETLQPGQPAFLIAAEVDDVGARRHLLEMAR